MRPPWDYAGVAGRQLPARRLPTQVRISSIKLYVPQICSHSPRRFWHILNNQASFKWSKMYVYRYENIEGIISTLLGGRVTLFVPSCAMRELRQLAKDDPELRAAATLARSFMRHKDNCPPSESSTDCLLKQVGARLARACPQCLHWCGVQPMVSWLPASTLFERIRSQSAGHVHCECCRRAVARFLAICERHACRQQQQPALVARDAGPDDHKQPAQGAALWPLPLPLVSRAT